MTSKHRVELIGYIGTAVGMALACSGYAMLGQLSALVSGPALMLAVLLGGLLCIAISASVAELASAYPSAPGVRTYLRVAFGDQRSLAVSYALLAMVALFAGVESHAFYVAVAEVLPGVPALPCITLVLGSVVAMNLLGFEWPQRIQLAFAALLVVVLAGVSLTALALPSSAAGAVASGSAGAFASQLALATGGTIFLFTGFEWVAPLGRNAEAYRSRIPWSMPIALLVLLVLFMLLTAARIRHLPLDPQRGVEAPHVALGVLVLGRPGAYVMGAVSALSVVTTFNAGLMGTSRLVYALARERCLPGWAATVSLRSGAPVGAVLGVGGVCWAAAVLEELFHVQLASSLVCAAIYCGVYAAYVWASVRLRRAAGGVTRTFTNVVPAAAQMAIVVLLLGLGASLLFAEQSVVRLTLALFGVVVGCCAVAANVVAWRRASGATRAAVAASASGTGGNAR